MNQTHIDETLAFTALREMDPEFGDRTFDEYVERRDALLQAWYTQWDVKNFWEFTRKWLNGQKEVASQ